MEYDDSYGFAVYGLFCVEICSFYTNLLRNIYVSVILLLSSLSGANIRNSSLKLKSLKQVSELSEPFVSLWFEDRLHEPSLLKILAFWVRKAWLRPCHSVAQWLWAITHITPVFVSVNWFKSHRYFLRIQWINICRLAQNLYHNQHLKPPFGPNSTLLLWLSSSPIFCS